MSPTEPLAPIGPRTIWACSLCGTYWPRPAEARGCCEAGALRHDVVHESALYEANVEIKRLGVENERLRECLREANTLALGYCDEMEECLRWANALRQALDVGA